MMLTRIWNKNRRIIEEFYWADGRRYSTWYSLERSRNGLSFSLLQSRVDYSDNFIYEKDTLSKVLIPDGYIDCKSRRPVAYFYLKDHQGNNRLVLNTSGDIVQINRYYPFGALWGESTDGQLQKYKYNGKELDRMHGLDWYDYGARWMDPILGRFTSVDPLCEKYYSISLYVYCNNNPVNFVDPDGRDWYKVQTNDEEWKYEYNDQIHSQDELDKIMKGGIYLGKTYIENNTYYSLFGSKLSVDSFDGQIYQLVDKAIIKENNAKIERSNSWAGEDIGSPLTDFSITGKNLKSSKYLGIDTHRNEYSIIYENSSIGVYRITGDKNSMKAYMEDWIGNRDMPKHIGGWQSGKQMYHIRFQNKKGFDIIHLQYSQKSASIILKKYNNLFK